MAKKYLTFEEKFWSHVKKTDSCWEWDVTRHHNGYGKIRIGKKKFFSHRVSYELKNGPIPKGKNLDHLCRNPACINPDHLEAVSQKENILRGIGPTAINAKKTHCKRGHQLVKENLCKWDKAARRCRICINDLRKMKK